MEKMICRQGMADTPKAWIYYKESGHGVPILMLHGNAETHMIFDFYEKKLSANYRVILMDSRGHGRSMTVRQSFTIHDMACDAAALLDHLGIAKAILLGFSDGANIALEFACCFPERTLAVISASGNALSYGLRFPVRLAAQFTGCALSFLKNRLPDSSLRLQLTKRLQLNSLLTDSPHLSAGRLQHIQAPVLILAGTRDLIKPSHSRWLARQIPTSRLLLMTGGRHTSIFRTPAPYLRAILAFLRRS